MSKRRRKAIIDMVYDYIESNFEKIEFISGKWFYKKEEIKNPKDFLIRLSRRDENLRREFFDFMDPNEIDKWLDLYKDSVCDSVRPMGWWYESKYARLGRELALKNEEIKVNYKLSEKQLVMIHIMLYEPNEEVMFINTGIGGSGKSTFGNLVQQLFDDDVAACSLEDLSNEFNVAEAVKHRLIYADELNGDIINNGAIKTLVSKQKINQNAKNKTPIIVQSQSALFFNCNKLPKFDIGDSGMMRRIIYNHMNKKIVSPDTSLNRKVFTQQELINIAALAYKQDVSNWRSLFNEDTRKLLAKDNSVYICNRCNYEDYASACKKKNLKPFGEPNWKEIREVFQEWRLIEDDELPF